MKTSIAYIVVNGTINAYVDGKQYSIASDSPYFEGAKAALKNKDAKGFVANADLDKTARERSRGQIAFAHGVIRWNGQPVHNALTKRILALINQDFDFQPLLNFLENVLKNPDPNAVEDLYRFLESNTLPLVEDGCFLAWKRVTTDFKDFYSGKVDNRVGQSPSIDRTLVNKSREVCSGAGLYVASKEYLKHYHNGEGVLILVKVNPQDVCAVPTSYENTKMRVCKYTVLQSLPISEIESANETVCGKAVYSTSPVIQRDSRGRFCKK